MKLGMKPVCLRIWFENINVKTETLELNSLRTSEKFHEHLIYNEILLRRKLIGKHEHLCFCDGGHERTNYTKLNLSVSAVTDISSKE